MKTKKTIKYKDYKEQALKDPELKLEYDALQPEFDIIELIIKTRKTLGMTQKDLSKTTGITQADISRIENGTRNPSLEMIKRLARGMGMQLEIRFVPLNQKETN